MLSALKDDNDSEQADSKEKKKKKKKKEKTVMSLNDFRKLENGTTLADGKQFYDNLALSS